MTSLMDRRTVARGWVGAAAALALALITAPAPAGQPTVDFACGKPVMGFGENQRLSKYPVDVQERVFEVKVYLGGAAGSDGIGLTPTQNGVCRVVLPTGAIMRFPVTWREANASPDDRALYDSIQIHNVNGSRVRADWLVLHQSNPRATGATTIEFHVIYNQLSAAQN